MKFKRWIGKKVGEGKERQMKGCRKGVRGGGRGDGRVGRDNRQRQGRGEDGERKVKGGN